MNGLDKKIYLKQEEIWVGCGSTAKKTQLENYYQVAEVDGTKVKIQLLDINDQPVGPAAVIETDELKEYVECPDYFEHKKGAKQSKDLIIEKRIQLGDRHFEENRFFSAEYQYNKALALDEENIRANLGKGKSLFARGEREKARKIFSRISTIEALFDVENKHIFNEFGIELRKKGMVDQAIANYEKAISIDPNDEVLHYNLGRAHYEHGDREKAVAALNAALALKSEFKEAKEFLASVLKRSLT